MKSSRMFSLSMRTFAVVLALPVVTVFGAQSLPSYSRATTPGSYGVFDTIVAVIDCNGDGRQDILIGGDRRLGNTCVSPSQRPLPPPLRVMISNGDGTFRDGTAETVERDPGSFFNPAIPTNVVADFNNDGQPDVAVFDYGTECGSALTGHTFHGYPPILLLSGPDHKWRPSNALADAVTQINAQFHPQYIEPNIRVLSASAADINSDGQRDIWVESCGGENICSHFLMNNGDGTFTVNGGRVPSDVLHNPRPEFWRHNANALVDLNGDGYPDLVLGQMKDSDPTHINGASLVLFNSGRGRFPLEGRVLLPAPEYAEGYGAVTAMAVSDLDGDGQKDLIFVHRRGDGSGRYVQVLMNRGAGRFVDDTIVRMGDQSRTISDWSALYAQNLNKEVVALFMSDVNKDGVPDLVLNSPRAYIDSEVPLVYLNNGAGQFSAMDPNVFTNGDRFFGENSVPLDLNGDGIVDFVHTNLHPGPDGTLHTGDDVTQLIALVGRITN